MKQTKDIERAKYAHCRVQFLDTLEECDVVIKLTTEIDEDEDEDIFYYCESPDELHSLRRAGCAEDFVIREIYSYEADDDEADDEAGSGGLWDEAAEIALEIARSRGASTPVYAEEWGQEIIYNALKRYAER